MISTSNNLPYLSIVAVKIISFEVLYLNSKVNFISLLLSSFNESCIYFICVPSLPIPHSDNLLETFKS